MTGHSLDVFVRHYAGDYGKAQRATRREPGCSRTASAPLAPLIAPTTPTPDQTSRETQKPPRMQGLL
jgi:hypothetical protein